MSRVPPAICAPATNLAGRVRRPRFSAAPAHFAHLRCFSVHEQRSAQTRSEQRAEKETRKPGALKSGGRLQNRHGPASTEDVRWRRFSRGFVRFAGLRLLGDRAERCSEGPRPAELALRRRRLAGDDNRPWIQRTSCRRDPHGSLTPLLPACFSHLRPSASICGSVFFPDPRTVGLFPPNRMRSAAGR